MKQLLILTVLVILVVSCQKHSIDKSNYVPGHTECVQVLGDDHLLIDVCEVTVGKERTCLLQAGRAGSAVSCRFYDEAVRVSKHN